MSRYRFHSGEAAEKQYRSFLAGPHGQHTHKERSNPVTQADDLPLCKRYRYSHRSSPFYQVISSHRDFTSSAMLKEVHSGDDEKGQAGPCVGRRFDMFPVSWKCRCCVGAVNGLVRLGPGFSVCRVMPSELACRCPDILLLDACWNPY